MAPSSPRDAPASSDRRANESWTTRSLDLLVKSRPVVAPGGGKRSPACAGRPCSGTNGSGRSPAVASRWRIRHKLLLGVGLVVAVLALLLGGTLRGLWSYYVTTNNIRAKLHELSAAAVLEAAVTEAVSPENVPKLLENPENLRAAVRKVQVALDAYSDQLDDTLANGRDPNHGVWEKAQIECLRNDLAAFQEA